MLYILSPCHVLKHSSFEPVSFKLEAQPSLGVKTLHMMHRPLHQIHHLNH